ncbi:MAG TPA: ABC transporter ATP-binding protein [Dehalococcoidia bacterium]|nr:ABC transporter ATP-binding protein [Dehalococcoidia bacterium]
MLEVRGLRGGYRDRAVLHDIDLRVERGEVCVLLGPNGCGKSTLLRAITGALPLAEGDVRIEGVPVRGMSAADVARRVAVVAQAAPLPERFIASDVVMMGRTPHLRLLQSEGRRDAAIVRDAMRAAGCWELRERYVDELSGGEAQRVLIARALAQEPLLLLLDEPTSHLDLRHQVATFALVRDLCRARGIAAVAVVHDLTLGAMFADRVALMADGRIVAAGAPHEVLRAEAIAGVYGVPVRVVPHPVSGTPVVVVAPPAGAARTQGVAS